MGKVVVKIKLENWMDVELVALGKRKPAPRQIETDALVDTGAVKLYIQSSLIKQLGLRPVDTVQSRTMSDRTETRRVFSPARLEIQGRTGHFAVIEIPDTLPNLIGQIPLEDLDWVVDPRRRRLIPNPDHKHGERYDEF